MKAIVFVGHGEFPAAMKNSAEMIAGENDHLYSVSLVPEDGKEEFVQKLRLVDQLLETYETILIFADLLGGSPCNAAIETYVENEKVQLISGMNLPMVLTAIMADSSNEWLITEGKDGIQDVKEKLRGKSQQSEKTTKFQQGNQTEKKKQGKPYLIKNVRVDARGIHGQVATAWVPKLGINRIVVIDDLAVKDETQKIALKMAKPNTVKLSILSTKKAIERLRDENTYQDEELLILIQRIETLERLAKEGYFFKEVTMGNVPNRPNTMAYRKTVNLTETEVDTIKSLINQGTHFTAQMVPADGVVDFDQIINS